MPLPPTFPDLAALDLFVSVVQLGSVSQAAAEHQISQPSASARIRNLERQLGLKLLTRSPTGSTPTAEGSVVVGWAESVLRAADELGAGVDALKATATGLLRVTASFTIAEYLLPPWLEQFLRNRPDDSVALEVANSAAVVERVAGGTIDLGFVESPLVTRTGLRSQVVATDELITVVAAGHPWARRDEISLDALATTPLVLREKGSGTREALEHALDALGYDPPASVLALGSTSAVRVAVINGSSPTVISHLAVADDIEAGSLVKVEVPGLHIARQLRAIWTARGTLPPLAQALLAQLPSLDA